MLKRLTVISTCVIALNCHLKACKTAIPFAQAMRLRRICSRKFDFEKRAADLTPFLVNRGKKKGIVRNQLDKARRISRTEALRDKHREKNERVPFVVMCHPELPNIGQILRDLHPIMQSPERCHRVVSNVPMLAFRGPKNFGGLSCTDEDEGRAGSRR